MPAHADIDVRMKENYEKVYRIKMTKRMPVIVRLDGRAFHSFTKKFDKPFDTNLVQAMQFTMKYLCENVMGCVLGYTQSDEISLLLIDYKNFQSQPFFDNNVQKIASVTASMATLEFNRVYERLTADLVEMGFRKPNPGATFDSRCFNIPREEVTNYFYSRQIDATRNSIQMVGQSKFSHKELHNKSTSDIQDMLVDKYQINWNDFSIPEKRGTCCIKETYIVNEDGEEVPYSDDLYLIRDDIVEGVVRELDDSFTERSRWVIDCGIPIFKGEGRRYIEKFVDLDK